MLGSKSRGKAWRKRAATGLEEEGSDQPGKERCGGLHWNRMSFLCHPSPAPNSRVSGSHQGLI
jgi:hypothetical protein